MAAASSENSTPSPSLPPALPSMQGTLFCYHRDEYNFRMGFKTNDHHRRHLILIGGLGDGLMPVPYTIPLAQALDARGFCLVQVLLSSSYTGFGHASLQSDCEELGKLIRYLEEQEGSEAVGLVGHSTGCQDSVVYVRDGQAKGKLRFAVLQAPVSDREHLLDSNAEAPALIARARALREAGQGQEMMPRAAMWAPITADRFLDLATKEGADDFFSSDLTDAELRERLGHLDVPTLFLFSGADEYVPASVDVPLLGRRFVAACQEQCPLPKAVTVEGAKHSGRGHEEAIVKEIVGFIDEAMAIQK